MLVMKLSEMKLNEAGTVTKIAYKGSALLRLLDVGIYPNMPIMLKRAAPLGDPLIAEVGDILIALRKKDAENIEVTV
jgi:ferrous iron transport protein A